MARSAYLLTFGTYGSRLHGDPRGTVDRHHNGVGDQFLLRDDTRRNLERQRMRGPAFEIAQSARRSLESAFGEVAAFRGWSILALSIRMAHIHAVVIGDEAPGAMIGAFRAYGTRRLRADGIVGTDTLVWASRGSGRPLRTGLDVERAVDYVANRQGALLPGSGALHQLGRRRQTRAGD